ncbi:acyl transferase [Flavobacteriales bacterium]|jgi:phenylacetate-coenzyme A ligase PaaK-like adenylate-forming protein|nr:acyl transferase [Flavobacteriales bacterium]
MHWVFEKQTTFEEKALKAFQLQAKNCQPYTKYLKLLNTDVSAIKSITEIPFLPIEFFKSHQIISNKNTVQKIFTSSGTTGQDLSQHCITDINVYIESFRRGFNHFYGNIKDYRILALLPSYLERDGSSLVFMCKHLIEESKHTDSGFYLNNIDELASILQKKDEKKTLLIGVSYALLDLAEQYPTKLENTIVMETGGMKGKRKEMVKSELHDVLKKAFHLENIHSEYGMTELLSQAYSKKNGVFETPHWMKVFVRDAQDPLTLLGHQQTGGINVIDLANINSCSFIATQDLGKTIDDYSFELKGRLELSDIRGCNLLVE